LDLIELYEPDVMAIKALHPARRSKYLEGMVAILTSVARSHKMKVVQCAIEDLKKESTVTERVNNKKKLTETMAARFPTLYHDLKRERGHKDPYYVRMFEAVALANLSTHELKR
jgi:hypothetical protein